MNSEIKFVEGGYNGSEEPNLYHVYLDNYSGKIPTFIVYNKDKNLYTRIKLRKPEYIHHDKFNGILSKEECISLNEWFNEKDEPQNPNNTFTKWRALNAIWNINSAYESTYIPKNPKQPDYTKLYTEE